MVSSWLLDAKLTAPTLPPDRVRRALLDPLPPFVTLEGGPGAGKTQALAELMARLARAGVATLWYGLDADEQDHAAFFFDLVTGLRRQVPDFGESALAMLRDGRLAPRGLWRAVIADVAAYGLPPLTVALDDAHWLSAEPDVLGALIELVERFPPGFRVVVASRRPLPVARQLASGLAARLDEAALRFSPSEVEAFLGARARGRAVPQSWRERAAGLEGWPLGLALVTAGGGETVDEAALESYVLDELLRSQTPDRQAFMLRASLLPTLDAEACQAALGQPAATLLAGLHGDHLVTRLAGSRYGFPAHLRSFLRAEAGRVVPADELKQLHQRIAGWLCARDQAALALPHWIAAEDWGSALQAARTVFAGLRAEGRFGEIAQLLAAFPQARREREPLLTLWAAHGHARAGRTAEATGAYEQARAGFAALDDTAGELAALARLVTAAAQDADLPRFNRLSVQALARAGEASPEDLAELHLARALLAERRGDLALARECNQAVLDLPQAEGAALVAARLTARLNLSAAALWAGDLDQALGHATHARDAATAHGLAPLAAYAAFCEARALLGRGEAGAAAAAIAHLPADWPDLLDWPSGGQAHVVLGLLRTAEEAWEEAEAALRAARGRFEATGSPEGRKLAAEAFAWLALRRRQYARVAALVAEAEIPLDPALRNAYDLALALPQARALHLAGDAPAAVACLAEALPGLAAQGLGLLHARARLILAAATLEAGDRPAAEAALAEAERVARAIGLDQPGALDPALWRSLAPLRAAPVAAAPASLAPTAPARARPEETAPTAAAAAPVGALALTCFGRFEVRLAGQPLDRWPRRKAKLALAALALKGGSVSSFELGELLGEGDLASGQGILKVTMPALRRALEPALSQGANSAYIRTLDEGYALVESLVADCDVRRFEQALKRAGQRRAEAPLVAAEAYEDALALYRGDLFDEPLFAQAFEAERGAMRRQALDAALWLADHRASLGDRTGAEAALLRAAEVAPMEEEVYVHLMRHHQAAGRPERVRQAYWDCRKALKRHVGIAPSADFEAAHQGLIGPRPQP